MNSFFKLLLFSAGGLLAITGCQPRHYEMPEREVVGYSVNGYPIETISFGRGEDLTLIMATIHGNENAGTPLVYQLISEIRKNKSLLDNRKVVIVPVVNPDGYAANSRTNSRGIDLNRNFAASNRENNRRYGITKLSEPESRVIVKLLEQLKPDRIVTIHQPLHCIDYDGPALPLAEHMGLYSHLPVKKLGSRPGSLGSYAGEDLQIPIITYELPRSADTLPLEVLWRDYGPSLVAAITYPEPVAAFE